MRILLRCSVALLLVVGTADAWAQDEEEKVQMATIYSSTDPTEHDPGEATMKVVTSLIPTGQYDGRGEPIMRVGPKCAFLVSKCEEEKARWHEVQAAAKALGDYQLGRDGNLSVIVVSKRHPDGHLGHYSAEHRTIILYPTAPGAPDSRAKTVAHETGHEYVKKHNIDLDVSCDPCTSTGIKTWGVNEGFAKIVEHRVTGTAPAAPSADNVEDILEGANCKTKDGKKTSYDWKCAHDIGNLVFEAYKELVDAGVDYAFEVYRDAIRDFDVNVTMTPATLHDDVSERIERILRQRGVLPQEGVNNYAEGRGASFWLDYWSRWLWWWRIISNPPSDESPH